MLRHFLYTKTENYLLTIKIERLNMKKVDLLMMFSFASVFCFAESFSKAKFSDLYKNSRNMVQKYCYEAEISKESNKYHAGFGVNYLVKELKEKDAKNIDAYLNKFSAILASQRITAIKIKAYYMAGLVQESKDLALKNRQLGSIYKEVLMPFFKTKDYTVVWEISKANLTKVGGISNPKVALNILNDMFKYIPNTITKEQQIALLETIAQKYPIPGTDFNQWKSFMGFVGYKYKALTGKELYSVK